MRFDESVKQLSGVQRKAVVHNEGPLLILSGAGSGKTRVIAHRIANLINVEKVPSDQVLAVTFTNKATNEMRGRIEELVGQQATPSWIGTFHAICNRILRPNIKRLGNYDENFTIYDATDQRTIVKEALKRTQTPCNDIYSVIAEISNAKNNLMSPEEYAERATTDDEIFTAPLYTVYQGFMQENNGLDFDDLIRLTIKLFQESKRTLERYQKMFQHILVDEYQDTNHGQYLLVNMLADQHRNLCVVGDDDQSVYGWRGADIGNILSFENDYIDATVLKLEQNYRSSYNIIHAARSVVENNKHRKAKHIWTENKPGIKIVAHQALDPIDEAEYVRDNIKRKHEEGVNYKDMTILYRVNSQSRQFETTLKAADIPHVVLSGDRFYDNPEIKDILAYMQVVVNPSDSVAMKRIINNPHRGIGVTPISLIQRYADAQDLKFHEAVNAIELAPTLHESVKKRVVAFRELMESFSCDGPPTETVEALLDLTGYHKAITKGGSIKAEGRKDNIHEFIIAISEYEENAKEPTLEGFLTQVTSMSEPAKKEEDTVLLMTLHSAKGLEFPIVFMVGIEEGLLPHKRSIESPSGIEEERRLCYVGMTRAEEELYMTHSYCRKMFYPNPSRFLDEVPDEFIVHDDYEEGTTSTIPFKEQQPEELSIVQKQILEDIRSYLEDDNTPMEKVL